VRDVARGVPRDLDLPPEPEDVHARREQAPEVEELGLPRDAVIVVDREIHEAEAGELELLDELEADDAARVLQCDSRERRAPDEPEVAVHVAHVKLKEDPHEDDVDLADHDAVERVRARDLVAVDDVHAFLQDGKELPKLEDIVLAVAVRVEDEVLRGLREARAQRGAVSAVRAVVDDPQRRIRLLELFEDGALLSFEPSSMTRISNARPDSAPTRFAPATSEPIVAASLKQGKNIVRLGGASVGTTPILSGPT